MNHKRLSRTVIYESPWVNLYVDKVVFPDGAIIEKHHYLDFHKEAAACVVENEVGEVLLIQSYRYVTNSLEWEVPAGGIEDDETIIEAARRETLEETGYSTVQLEHIYSYNPSNGISNQVFHIVKGKAGAKVGTFDKNEVKDVKWFTKAEIKNMIKKKEIRDGYALTALLLHFLL